MYAPASPSLLRSLNEGRHRNAGTEPVCDGSRNDKRALPGQSTGEVCGCRDHRSGLAGVMEFAAVCSARSPRAARRGASDPGGPGDADSGLFGTRL